MKKIELPTALVMVATIVCLTVLLIAGPEDVRSQLLVAVGAIGTSLAALLPKLFAESK